MVNKFFISKRKSSLNFPIGIKRRRVRAEPLVTPGALFERSMVHGPKDKARNMKILMTSPAAFLPAAEAICVSVLFRARGTDDKLN